MATDSIGVFMTVGGRQLNGRRQHFSEPMRQHGCLFIIAALHTLLARPPSHIDKAIRQGDSPRSAEQAPPPDAPARGFAPSVACDAGVPIIKSGAPGTCRKRNVRTEPGG